MGAPTFYMDRTLGDPLTILVCQLLEQLVILHEERAARTGGHRVLIVGNGRAGRVVNLNVTQFFFKLFLIFFGPIIFSIR